MTSDLVSFAPLLYQEGSIKWLELTQSVIDESLLDTSLASGNKREKTQIWANRNVKRAMQRSSVQEKDRVTSALLELRQELDVAKENIERLRSQHTIGLVAIVINFLVQKMGYEGVDLHVLCAMVFLLVETADWLAPVSNFPMSDMPQEDS